MLLFDKQLIRFLIGFVLLTVFFTIPSTFDPSGFIFDTAFCKNKVQFTEATYNLFIKLKEEQQREKRKMGNQWNNNDFIFKTQFGYPIDPSRASQLFYEVTKKHDLRHIPFHGLRHTSVSLLLANGVNTHAVSKRVGHSNVSTTQEIYAHLFKSVEQEAVNMMNNILR